MKKEQLLDSRKISDVATRAVKQAAKKGATQAEVAVGINTGQTVTVRLGEIESIERQRDRDLVVTVYFDHRKGAASTSDLSFAAIDEAIDAACAIAKHTSEDPCSGLAPAERMATDFPDLDLCHPWLVTPEEAAQIAKECEKTARDTDKRVVNSEGATVDTGHAIVAYANSHGFCGIREGTNHSLSCVVLAGDEHGMQRDYWYSTARRHTDLEDAEAVGRRAATRALARLGARRVKTIKAPVLFSPEVARSLLGHLVAAVSGGAQYRQSSFLLGAAGQQVLPNWATLVEDPYMPRGPGSRSFDDEGVATVRRELVSEGTLTGYVLGSYSARRLGLETTGNAGGIHNLSMLPGGEKPNAPLIALDSGLYVTELIGQGVNLVTGDYSRGAAGFWVDHGELAYPVEEITIAAHLKTMLQNMVTSGSDTDRRSRIQTGSLLIDSMTIAGE